MLGLLLQLLFPIYLGYRNSLRAKLKGQNALLWGFLTTAAMLVTFMIGAFVVMEFFMSDKINFDYFASAYPQHKKEFQEQLIEAFKSNPLLLFTIYFFGFGGYLLVRYIIDNKHGSNAKPMHWMDKLNEDNKIKNENQNN